MGKPVPNLVQQVLLDPPVPLSFQELLPARPLQERRQRSGDRHRVAGTQSELRTLGEGTARTQCVAQVSEITESEKGLGAVGCYKRHIAFVEGDEPLAEGLLEDDPRVERRAG